MSSILIYGGLTVLAFVCVLVVLFVLMQKPSANAGLGSALGGSTSESVFGGEAASVLSKATVIFIVAFFILCAVLYLAFLGAQEKGEGQGLELKETTEAPAVAAETAPADAVAPAAIVPAEEAAIVPAEPAPAPTEPAPATAETVPAQEAVPAEAAAVPAE